LERSPNNSVVFISSELTILQLLAQKRFGRKEEYKNLWWHKTKALNEISAETRSVWKFIFTLSYIFILSAEGEIKAIFSAIKKKVNLLNQIIYCTNRIT